MEHESNIVAAVFSVFTLVFAAHRMIDGDFEFADAPFAVGLVFSTNPSVDGRSGALIALE